MDVMINQIDELKQMQQFPRYHLSKYFDELKAQVDTKYALKLDEKDKYSEIINNIESFEQDAYNKWNSKRINAYDNEIKLIEDKLNNNLAHTTKSFEEVKHNLTNITKLIDEVKYKIEKMLFSNKSILFIDEKSRFYIRKGRIPYSFLIIVNDEYISNNFIDSDIEILTRNKLNDFFFKKKIQNCQYSNVLNLDIVRNLEELNFSGKNITEIHPSVFSKLSKLKNILFSDNQIKELPRNIFNELVNLERIHFGNNQIKEIHTNLFNGLAKLKEIDFSLNNIKEIDPNIFEGLVNLEKIAFSNNQISEIDPNLFTKLAQLKEIDFSFNNIKKIDQNQFNGLCKLQKIVFLKNQIKEVHQNQFNGLINLKELSFSFNKIIEIHQNQFIGLANLVKMTIRPRNKKKKLPKKLTCQCVK